MNVELVEQAFARNLADFVEAMQQVAPDAGAAAASCGDGVAAFLGVDSPLTTVKGASSPLSDEEIEAAEAFFRDHGARKATFELAPWISAETEERLFRRGYGIVDHEDVVVRERPQSSVSPEQAVSLVAEHDWAALQLRVNDEDPSAEWRALAEVSAILPGAIRLGLRDGEEGWVACAQLVPAPQVGIFGNDATLTSARRRGAQTALILERLKMAATLPFALLAAEVAPGSSSERNYLRCGFRVVYTRAHYARQLA